MFYRQVQLVAKKHRGPPRYFGKTKSQILDGVMRGNATTFAFIILCSMPVLVYMIHRFVLLDSAVARALICKSKQIARATADFTYLSGMSVLACTCLDLDSWPAVWSFKHWDCGTHAYQKSILEMKLNLKSRLPMLDKSCLVGF